MTFEFLSFGFVSDFGFLGLFVLGVLCPVEYSLSRGVSVALVMLFHGAGPVEYRLDRDRVVLPKCYSTGESDLSPIPYSQIQRKISYMFG